MDCADSAPSLLAVLDCGDRGGEQVREALDALDGDVTVTDGVGTALDRVDAGRVDCLVVDDAAAYREIRAEHPLFPVAVVTADVDAATLDRIVGDERAAHVAPGPALETSLAVNVDRLHAYETPGWRLAEFVDRAVVSFDLETRGLIRANQLFFDAWGWDRERFEAATLGDLRETDITDELRGQGRGDPSEDDLEWMRDTDPLQSLIDRAAGGRSEVREWHCERADGDPFKSEVRVVVDDRNRRGYLLASVPDSDRRGRHRGAGVAANDGADFSAEDQASMLQSLVEHVPMSVYFKDADSRHLLVSEDVTEPFIETPEGKFLHSPEDVHGKTDFDLYPAEGAEENVAIDREVMATGDPLVDELERYEPPAGRPLFFQTTKAPWYGEDGDVRGIVGVTVDVTDQKRRERELDRQNERLEAFASILSHDLRNPLNVAQGRLDIYRRTGDEDHLDTVAEMHDRMEALVEDVLTFAREGSRVEDPDWYDATALADEAWEAVDTADATLVQDWDHRMRAADGRVERLFENLFRNAVEHVGPAVTVSVGVLDDEPGFYVTDDGPGIPEDVRDDVFDRGVTTDDDGTGFGLAIVAEIADAHGWAVDVRPDPDGGTRFVFTGVALEPRGEE